MRDSTKRIIFAIIYSLIIILSYTVISMIFLMSDFLVPLGPALLITGGIMVIIWYLLPDTPKNKLGIKLFYPFAPGGGNQQKMWYAISGIVGVTGTIIIAILTYL